MGFLKNLFGGNTPAPVIPPTAAPPPAALPPTLASSSIASQVAGANALRLSQAAASTIPAAPTGKASLLGD